MLKFLFLINNHFSFEVLGLELRFKYPLPIRLDINKKKFLNILIRTQINHVRKWNKKQRKCEFFATLVTNEFFRSYRFENMAAYAAMQMNRRNNQEGVEQCLLKVKWKKYNHQKGIEQCLLKVKGKKYDNQEGVEQCLIKI